MDKYVLDRGMWARLVVLINMAQVGTVKINILTYSSVKAKDSGWKRLTRKKEPKNEVTATDMSSVR